MTSLLRSENGSSALQFAFVAPVFFALVLGIIELGRALWTFNALRDGVDQAVRYAIVREDLPMHDVEKFLAEALSPVGGATVTIHGLDPGFWTIEASAEFSFLVGGLLPGGPITLRAAARAPMR